MRALMIIAHGSRNRAGNDAVERLCLAIANPPPAGIDAVRAAFLELAEPSIEEGVARLAAEGASEIVAVPYFLVPGRHVSRDIPAILTRCRANHPECRVRLLPHLGALPGWETMIGAMLATALGPPAGADADAPAR